MCLFLSQVQGIIATAKFVQPSLGELPGATGGIGRVTSLILGSTILPLPHSKLVFVRSPRGWTNLAVADEEW